MNQLRGTAPLSSRAIRNWAILLILFGSIFRLRAYLAVDSLSHDEVCVVLNLMHRGITQLGKPLDYEQAAPLGFLCLEKSIGKILGYGELSMRLFPLLCGIALLPILFFLLAEMLGLIPALFGLLLAATEPWLIKWSVDVKPYSSDALLSALILWLMWRGYTRHWKSHTLALLTLTGTIALTLSFTSALILAGGGLTIFSFELHRRSWRSARRLAVAGCIWALVLAANITLIERPLIAEPYLQKYWTSQFMPLPPRSLHDLHWFVGVAHQTFRSTMKFGWPPLALATLLVGILWLWKRNRPALLLILSPLPLALLASGLREYPFGDRLLLYATPQTIVILTAALAAIFSLRHSARPVALLLLLTLSAQNIQTAAVHLIHPQLDEETKPILQYIQNHRHPTDQIVLSRYSFRAYTYYSPSFNLSTLPALNADGIDPQTIAQQMSPLQNQPRIWIILMYEDPTARHVEQALPLLTAKKMGQQLERNSIGNATLYLYDFSHK
jgi:Dolichyl-phosphate-mannose-protein mannosyltransferase